LATQRITIAKVGGAAAEVILQQLRDWSAARQIADPDKRSSDQWPPGVRRHADYFARQLRRHAHAPPVIYFAEWMDPWSTGDLFLSSMGHKSGGWLMPSGGPPPFAVCGDQFEVFGYGLPDGGRLAQHLAGAGPQQFDESDWFVRRLSEAVEAWGKLVERAVLVVLREVVAGTVTDGELVASLANVPGWLLAPESGSIQSLPLN
jgi:hypothetical protein